MTRAVDGGPLRLLVAGSRWPPESFLERLFLGLAGSGLEIWLALKNGAVPAATGLRSFRVSAVTPRSRLQARRRDLVPEVAPFLKHRWDAVYFPWNAAAVSLMPLMRCGIPSVVSCRGSQILVAPHVPGREAMTDRFPEMFEAATRVHCVSRDIQRAAERLGLDVAKSRVIPPAVDPAQFKPSRERPAGSSRPLVIVGVGSLIWRKGFEDALVALAHLRDRGVDFRYHLAGEGPDRQRLLFTAHDLGLQDRVIFHGNLGPEKVLGILQQSDVFLLSSVCEGISNAVLEAMSCGLAVVSTQCGGMDEVIRHGEHGLLVPLRDPEATAVALRQLAEDAPLRRRLGQSARQRIEEGFRLEDQISAFRDLVVEAVESSRP